jgi:hypothetical protein
MTIRLYTAKDWCERAEKARAIANVRHHAA